MLWIHASSPPRFEMDVRDALELLRVKGRHDPKANIFQLLHMWLLGSGVDRKWLIILDSADDTSYLHEPPSFATDQARPSGFGRKRRIDYLPPSCENGRILITTRSRDAALQVVDYDDAIQVGPMDDDSAVSLLQSKLGTKESLEDLAHLAFDLGNMPLALTQAASYIRQRQPKFSLQMYLQRLETERTSQQSLFGQAERDLRRDREAENSIFLTWQISFDQMQRDEPSAADLLALMSFFDGRSIPRSLLSKVGHDDEGRVPSGFQSSSATDDTDEPGKDFEGRLMLLVSYSFVSATNSDEAFTVHKLVQDATRMWLRVCGYLEKWANNAISMLASNFPAPEYANWKICRTVFPHALCMHDLKPKDTEKLKTLATTLDKAALYILLQGDLCSAETLYSSAREAWIKIHGPDNLITLGCMDNIAEIYWLQGRWPEAERLDFHLLERKTKTLRGWHPKTLINVTRLSSRLGQQGRYNDVEHLEEKVLEDFSAGLGPDHEATLSRKSHFASVLWNHNAWDKSLRLRREVAESSAKVLGKDHEDTMKSLVHVAACYRSQKMWKECEDQEREILEIKRNLCGPEHVSTLNSMASVASACKSQGKWPEATELEKVVIAGRTKVLGETHAATMVAMADLAATYQQQAQWKEAEEILSLLAQRRAEKFGNDNIITLQCKTHLANTYSYQCRWEEAEKLHVEVMESRTRVLGEDHPETLESMSRLIQAYNVQGKTQKARELQDFAMTMALQLPPIRNLERVGWDG